MNSRKILTVLVLSVIITTSKAQISFSYFNNTFSITTPSIKKQVINSQTPYTKVFLETGDGSFFQFTSSGILQQTFTKQWFFGSSNSCQPVAQLNTYYDTIRRPPHGSSFVFNPIISNGVNPPQNLLSGSAVPLKITPTVTTIIPGDTMSLAITYKNVPPQEINPFNRSVVAFYYNSTGVNNQFSPVNGFTQYNFSGTPVNAVRPHNGASLVAFNTLPQQIQNQLNMFSGSFSQALFFNVPYQASGPERNIFFSLAPNSNPADYNQLTSTVKAVLIDYSSVDPGLFVKKEIVKDFDIDFVSRDPNAIKAIPYCFKSFNDAANQDIIYTIDFANIGAGNANTIQIVATIPRGILFPAEQLTILDSRIGKTPFDISKQGNIELKTAARKCTYRLYPDTRKIKFTITNANLKGFVETKGGNNEGFIKFKLRTGNIIQDECMMTLVSIKFDSNASLNDACAIKIGCDHTICPDVFYDPKIGQ